MKKITGAVDSDFEILIQNVVLDDLSGQGCVSEVARVVQRPQRGKDIQIKATDDIRLFGIHMECRSTQGLTVYVECKWTAGASLSFDSIASNAAQNLGVGCDAFIVVTNSKFTAGALWDLYRLFQPTNTRLIVIDGPRLTEILDDKGIAVDPVFKIQDTHGSGEIFDGVVICDDMNAPQLGVAEVTLSFQNRTATRRSGRLFLQSNADWVLAEEEAELLVDLPPFGVQAFRLHATREFPDRKASLRIGLDLNGMLRSLSREYAGLTRLDFHPEFVGAEHEAALTRLVDALHRLARGEPTGFLFVTVFGAAGTGKSRLVQELVPRLNDVRFRWLKHEFAEPGVRANLEAVLRRAEVNGFPLGDDDEIHDGESLLRSFAYTARGFGNQIPVLVLEDGHNASAETCRALVELLKHPPAGPHPRVVILTGRTDHSHANADFQLLADFLLDLPEEARAPHVRLQRFDVDVTRTFIGRIIREAPPQVVDVIERLSGRVPAHIVQCVEWLLDLSAVRIVHRAAVGIVDYERFISNIHQLPPTMVALLADRYDLLGRSPEGQAAQRVLLAAALLGSSPPVDVLSIAGTGKEDAVRDLLIGRRFLEPAEGGVHLGWHHENLLLHFRNWLFGENRQARRDAWRGRNAETWSAWVARGREAARAAAVEVRGLPALLAGVDELSAGRLASLAGDHQGAVTHWRPMLDDLRRVTGYSTADIDAAYFEQLRFAYESVRGLGHEPALLPRILKAMTYIGGFSLSLGHGTWAADFGIACARSIPVPRPEKARLEFWLTCLKAHFLLDAGFVRRAQGLLLELQADLEADEALREDAHLAFEIYNCLGQLYGYLNHVRLSMRCFDIADGYAERLGDLALKGKQIADRSVLFQYSDFEKWTRFAADAERANATGGTVRHQRHAKIVMLSLEFLMLRDNPDELERISQELDTLQKGCEASNYLSLMPRFYLLRGAIAFARATGNLSASQHDDRLLDAAEQSAEHGLGVGTERGIGFTSWQLRNLKAMIALRRGNYLSARENLQSAFEIMRSDGLLFLGKADLTCPNQIVLANYIKLLHSVGNDRDIIAMLRDVRTYETADWTRDDAYEFALHTSLQHDALLARARVGSGLARDEKTGMGLVVWVP